MKPHIKRVCVRGYWFWGAFMRKESLKPFSLSRELCQVMVACKRRR